jgi:hypothetical protein
MKPIIDNRNVSQVILKSFDESKGHVTGYLGDFLRAPVITK